MRGLEWISTDSQESASLYRHLHSNPIRRRSFCGKVDIIMMRRLANKLLRLKEYMESVFVAGNAMSLSVDATLKGAPDIPKGPENDLKIEQYEDTL
jgi:hypothetical protein